MHRPCLKPLVIHLLTHGLMIKGIRILSIPPCLLNLPNSQHCEYQDQWHMEPTPQFGELLVIKGSSLEPVLNCLALMPAYWVNWDGDTQGKDWKVKGKLQESPLEEQIQVTISPAVGDPIIHVELGYYLEEESQKDVKSLGFVEQFSLVDLLYVEVPINGDLNYLKTLLNRIERPYLQISWTRWCATWRRRSGRWRKI